MAFFSLFFLSISFSFFRSFVRSFHLRSFLRSFFRFRFIHTHVHTYTFIPLRHMQFYIFLKKFSLDHTSFFTNIHPSIHPFPVPLLPYPPTDSSSLSPSNISFFPSSSCYHPPMFFQKKTCKFLYYLRPAIWSLTLSYFSVFSCLDLYISMYIYRYRYRCIFRLFFFLYI